MNYLARICLGALSSLLLISHPTFFSPQFPFYLWLSFFFFCSCSTKCLFLRQPVPIAPGTFLQSVASSIGKPFAEPIPPSEAAAKEKLIPFKTLCSPLCFPNKHQSPAA